MTDKREIAILLFLVLLPLLFFWRVITPSLADRATFPEGDFTHQYYPLRLFAARELAARRLPLWDPYIYSGQPALADIQSAVLYPPNLLGALLAGARFSLFVLEWQVILHFSLASLFTYLFVKRLTGSRFAAIVSALTFTYGGYLTSFPIQQLTMLEVAVWLPLILLLIDLGISPTPQPPPHRWLRIIHRSTCKAGGVGGWPSPSPHPLPLPNLGEEGGAERSEAGEGEGRRVWLALAGLALGLSILAGHPQTSLYVFYASLFYLIFQAYRHVGGLKKGFFSLLLFLLVGLGLAAIQILPTLEFMSLSTRPSELSYRFVSGGFALRELTALIIPGYFGGSPQYVGVLPLLLATMAVLFDGRNRDKVFWVGLGLLAFLLSFGGHTFFYSFFYLFVPGFSQFRNQERIIFLFSFSVAVLAGYGATLLVRPWPRSVRRHFTSFYRWLGRAALAALGLVALFYQGWIRGVQAGVEVNLFDGALRHAIFFLFLLACSLILIHVRLTRLGRRRTIMALTVGIILLNLFTVNWQYNLEEVKPEGHFPQMGAVEFLHQEQAKGGDALSRRIARASSEEDFNALLLLPAQGGSLRESASGQRFRISSGGVLPGTNNAGAVYGLEDITGNSPLHLASYREFEEKVGEWRRWQLLNVRYVVARQEVGGEGLEEVYHEGETWVYRMGDPLPRAYVVHQAVVAEGDEGWDVLNSPSFDAKRSVVLSEPPGIALPEGEATGSLARIVEYSPSRIVIEVEAVANGLLVLSEVYYPGWQARIDGRQAPLYRADGVLRAIPVKQGSHRVEVVYEPRSFKVGLAISGLTLLGLIAFVTTDWLLRRWRLRSR